MAVPKVLTRAAVIALVVATTKKLVIQGKK